MYYADENFETVARDRTGHPIGVNVTRPNYFKQNANGYRLPTSAEWEKAARGGLVGKRFSRGDTISNLTANIVGTLNEIPDFDTSEIAGPSPSAREFPFRFPRSFVPLMTHGPNGFGLFEVDGNLQELVWDSAPYSNDAPFIDPIGRLRGLRGGYSAAGAGPFLGSRQGQPTSDNNSGGQQPQYGVRLVRNTP